MDTDARLLRAFAESSTDALELAPAMAEPLADAEAARRSETNILHWTKYLPEKCINKMIEMGWDVIT